MNVLSVFASTSQEKSTRFCPFSKSQLFDLILDSPIYFSRRIPLANPGKIGFFLYGSPFSLAGRQASDPFTGYFQLIRSVLVDRLFPCPYMPLNEFLGAFFVHYLPHTPHRFLGFVEGSLFLFPTIRYDE